MSGLAFDPAWLWLIGPNINLIGAAACGLIGTLAYTWQAMRQPRGDMP